MHVPPLLDDIQEELKREDRIRLFKKWLPAIMGAALLVLGAAGVYSWHRRTQETTRVRYENYYTQATEALTKGQKDKARAMMTHLVKEAPALRLLALSQLARMDIQQCAPSALLVRHAQGVADQENRQEEGRQEEGRQEEGGSKIASSRSMLARHHQLAMTLTPSKAYREWIGLMSMMVDAVTSQPFYGPQPLVTVPLSLDAWASSQPSSLPKSLSKADLTNLQGVYDTETWSLLWKIIHAEHTMARHAGNSQSIWSWWTSSVSKDPTEMDVYEFAFLGSRPQPWTAGGRP
jgi:hypothetical protein